MGGINMIDIQCFFQAINASWINRITRSNRTWTILPVFYFNNLAPLNVIAKMTVQTETELPCLKEILDFYRQVIIAHTKSQNPDKINTKQDLFNQPIWGNRFLKFE